MSDPECEGCKALRYIYDMDARRESLAFVLSGSGAIRCKRCKDISLHLREFGIQLRALISLAMFVCPRGEADFIFEMTCKHYRDRLERDERSGTIPIAK